MSKAYCNRHGKNLKYFIELSINRIKIMNTHEQAEDEYYAVCNLLTIEKIDDFIKILKKEDTWRNKKKFT